MSLLQVVILAIVQGLAELLPVSSSAHVVVAEKLMGLDPSSPSMTLLLVMLHTGTMFAVIVYFWRQWHDTYFRNKAASRQVIWNLLLATVLTGVIGEAVIKIIEKTIFLNVKGAQIEDLFGHLEIVAPALAAVGALILIAGILARRYPVASTDESAELSVSQASLIGAVQGLCLPFRGFSRSGATISTGMLAGVSKSQAEAFSFALAVILTPAVVIREALRLAQFRPISGVSGATAAMHGLLGAACAFLAGLVALKWLSRWLQSERWCFFGVYCIVASLAVLILHLYGF
jgi:undecaprenyl-diphosphatase